MTTAEDYLIPRSQEALHSFGGVEARKEATRQFLDEKSFKPGLGAFDTSKIKVFSAAHRHACDVPFRQCCLAGGAYRGQCRDR